MASLFVPVLYLTIIIGGLVVFSYFYRKRAAGKRYAPWFSTHPERNAYVTLLQQTDPPAPDAVLKAALLRRAVADVTRVIRLREDKPALQALLQKGSVGDDLWNSLLAADKEMEAELLEVMHEANSFVQGWGQIIFTTAAEMMQNEKMKSIFDSIPESKAKLDSKLKSSPKKLPTIQSAPIPSKPIPGSPLKKPEPLSSEAVSKHENGLSPPASNVDTESIASSDGELASPNSKSGRQTPSKSPSKRNRRRK